MDPQIQAILNFLMSGNPGAGSPGLTQYGLGGNEQQINRQGLNTGAGENQIPSTSSFSPVNANPNYANTVQGFFNYNPAAGPRPFTSSPLKPGLAGQNSSRGSSGWNSFVGNDPNSVMKALSGGQ